MAAPDRPSGGGAWWARAVEVADLRPWRRARLELPDGLVVISGPNGAGKTSLVEAIGLGTLGVSPRTAREAEAVRRGAAALRVVLELSGPDGTSVREIGVQAGVGRRLRIDGQGVRSLAAWRARGAVLVFLPEELRSVKGPPAARRRVVDRLVEAVSADAAEPLAGYTAALAQRNALLRRIRAGLTGTGGLAPWDARVAELSAAVVLARRAAVRAIAPRFAVWLAALGGGPGGDLALEPSPAELAGVADDAVPAALAASLAAGRERDLAAAQTLSGPHRDDVWIGAGGADLRRTGSQGEQRTAVLALLLACRDHLAARGAAPILLLDDVLSELDPRRRRALLDGLAGGGQTLVTSADPDAAALAAASGAALHLRVEAGEVVG